MQKMSLKENTAHGSSAFPIAIYSPIFNPELTNLAELHYHNEFELLLVTRGSMTVSIEDFQYHLSENQGIFINASQLHMITAEKKEVHGFVAIVFDYKVLCTQNDILFTKYVYPLMTGQLKIDNLLSPIVCQLIRSINCNFQSADFGAEILVKQELLAAFRIMLEKAEISENTSINSKSRLVKEVLDYIVDNYQEQISLQMLADHVHISKEYLCRIFHQMSDVSPITYLNRYRIQQSTELLLKTNKSITEISQLSGFNHCSYFNKLFLEMMGCRPTEYRQKMSH